MAWSIRTISIYLRVRRNLQNSNGNSPEKQRGVTVGKKSGFKWHGSMNMLPTNDKICCINYLRNSFARTISFAWKIWLPKTLCETISWLAPLPMYRGGGVSQTTSLQGRMVWEEGRNNRPVLPVKSALFCLWNTVAGNKRPQSTAMDLSRMWH